MVSSESNLALRQQVIADFQQGLQTLDGTQVHTLPDLSGLVNHDGLLVPPTIQLRPGIYLDNSYLRTIGSLPVSTPDNFSFLVQPGQRLGRENSHNHVFFGKLQGHWLAGDTHLAEAPVAVKPAKDRGVLLSELAMFQYLQSLNLPTYEPTGLLVTDTTSHNHLLTKFDGPVETMDSIDWRALDTDEKWAQVNHPVETVAMLSSRAIFHGDLEFKNNAYNERGEVKIVDPEFMVSARELACMAIESPNAAEKSRAALRIKQLLAREFNSIELSIGESIFSTLPESERPRNEVAKVKHYNRHLFRPYRAALKAYDSPYEALLLQSIDKVASETKQRAKEAS